MSNKITNVVLRQKNELLQQVNINFTPRIALPKFTKRLNEPLIKVILGPRRCGKSTMAFLAMEGRSFAYINFKDDSLPSDISGDAVMTALDQVYGIREFYFFDEIQNMDRWEQFLNRLHREGKNCIVTGSNAHLLSSELASALTGRHVALELFPFSYPELLASQYPDNLESFDYYLNFGGFPQVVMKQVDGVAYLSTLWDSVVLKDVVQRHKVRNVAALNDIYGLLLNAVSSKFSYESLARAQGNSVSSPTIKKFLRYAREAYLIVELEQFHFSPRKRMKSDRKAYTFDNGFVNAKRVPISKDLGRLLENLVFCELLRRGARPNIDLFYYITSAGHEVDFLLRRAGTAHELIQVSWIMTEQKTRERELRSLRNAARELNLSSVKILTHNHSELIDLDGITIEIQPVRQWLVTEQ